MLPYTKTDVLLNIDHVSLSFGDRVILRDVNAEIKDIIRPDCVAGQVICFLGPSGIGKTQLSRIIAGLQTPSSGKVQLRKGRTSSTVREVGLFNVEKGDVGMVAQNYPLFDFTTVEANLKIAGRQSFKKLPPKELEEKARGLMETFDLYKYREYYPSHLSGGTRQRVAFIRQLMCAEHFLVLDEPFSGLDLIMKQRACELITKVANLDELNTIILVTHDVTEGLSVADTVWLMGREPAPEIGLCALKDGARLVEQYDLAKDGLCWEPGLTSNPRFLEFVAAVKERFRTL